METSKKAISSNLGDGLVLDDEEKVAISSKNNSFVLMVGLVKISVIEELVSIFNP